MAYDISHLLDVEPEQADAPALRVVRAVPAVAAKPAAPSLADIRQATARELMQAATAHDAMVQEYLRTSGETCPEAGSEPAWTGQGTLSLFG